MHGKCAHRTSECQLWRKVKKSGFQITERGSKLKIQRTNGGNKTNPFLAKAEISDKPHFALIDTGADKTLVNKMYLPKNQKIHKSNTKMRSVTGENIKLLGKTYNLPATIDNKTVFLDPHITDKEPTDTIIGVDTIRKYPDILLRRAKEALSNETHPNRMFSSAYKQAQIAAESCSKRIPEEISRSLSEEVKRKYASMFASELNAATLCSIKFHEINTGTHPPICQANGRVPIQLEKAVSDEIAKLLRIGIIRPSTSSWRSRIVVAPKPNGKIRMCIDYRALNNITERSAYPLPRIDEIFDTLSKATVFSIVDATAGYHQIAMKEEDIEKTAFAWKGQLYEYTRMPFRLCNAPSTFQNIMNIILGKDNWVCAIPYLDDVIIFSKDIHEHKQHLERVLGKIKAAGLTLNNEKCQFFKSEIKYLGYILSQGQIRPDPEKLQLIKNFNPPTTLKELRSFLGLSNFCSQNKTLCSISFTINRFVAR